MKCSRLASCTLNANPKLYVTHIARQLSSLRSHEARPAVGGIIAVLLLLILPVSQVAAADIQVDGDCSLENAIRSANGDAQQGSLSNCEAGDAPKPGATPPETGADTIFVSANITLDAVPPSIRSEVTLNGGGFTITYSGTGSEHRLRC